MVTQLGQFLDHDITLTPEDEAHDCCLNPEGDESCFPIVLPQNDTFYSTLSTPQTCLEFTRSTAWCEDLSKVREQMNGITAFVDASNVYGSADETIALLRSGVDGKLLANSDTSTYTREMLPEIEGLLTAGDVRALEMPGLATMHTLMLREHNRLATEIRTASAGLEDETVFQMARRILIAEWQNVIYSEYLPVVLGDDAMKKYRLNLPSKNSDTTKYSDSVDPSITNSFATAAYRFGHSMIQGLISMMSLTDPATLEAEYKLRDHYFNMENYFLNSGEGMEQILQGLVNQPAQEMDRSAVETWSECNLAVQIRDGGGHQLPLQGCHAGLW
jgi:peroxidase